MRQFFFFLFFFPPFFKQGSRLYFHPVFLLPSFFLTPFFLRLILSFLLTFFRWKNFYAIKTNNELIFIPYKHPGTVVTSSLSHSCQSQLLETLALETLTSNYTKSQKRQEIQKKKKKIIPRFSYPLESLSRSSLSLNP